MSFTYGNKNKIILDGNYLEMAEIYVVDETIELENQLGVKRNITTTNGAISNVEEENFTFTLSFIRKDHYTEKIKPIDKSFLDRVNRLFFGKENDDYSTLEIGYYIYYVKAVEGSLKRYDKNNAVFSITFESLSPYKYTHIFINPCRTNTRNTPRETDLTIQGDCINYCSIKINCIADGDIKITNRRYGDSITMLGCTIGEKAVIDGENVDVEYLDFSRVEGNIKSCLTLRYGSNRYLVETTGDFEVSFMWQERLGLY